MKKIFAVLATLILLTMTSCGSGGGESSSSGGDTNTPENEELFTNGDTTLNASVVDSESSKTVTVSDPKKEKVLTLDVTTSAATYKFPNISEPTVINFESPLTELPTEYAAKRMAVYVAGQISSNAVNAIKVPYKDNPGCDWFPDTKCDLGCCADHDECYEKNGCTARSWTDLKLDACDTCNAIVVGCMSLACRLVNVNNQSNNCYNTRCKKHYDCPPYYNTCDCKDICTYTLSGRVIENGKGIKGITITLSGPVSESTKTDSNGYYEFNNLTNGDYTLQSSTYATGPGSTASFGGHLTIKNADITNYNFESGTLK